MKYPFFIIAILIVCFLFFSKLFIPHLSLISTPDFGQSDLLHGYYPIKYLLSESLKINRIPLWTSNEAGGYPIFADGQIGALMIINILLFKFLSFPLAINLGYVFIFFIGGLGTYLYCTEININKLTSLLAAIIFSLSGFNIGQITHTSLLQAASFVPLEFYLVERILKKQKISDILIFSIILSQQILSGHQQMTVYSLISLTVYIFFRFIFLYHNIKKSNFKNIRNVVFILLGVVFGILMSSTLLIASLELFKQSGARNNIDVLSQFPYPLNNLITFINPFYFGNPAIGTYPSFSSNWGIFWENNGYVGIIPLICLILSIFFIKKNNIKIWLCVLCFSLLMILGRNSPLYLLYNFLPLSFFRVPSRFLLLTDFSLAIISAIVVENFFIRFKIKQKIMLILGLTLIIFQIFNIFYYFYNYHAVNIPQNLFSTPDTIKYLNQNKNDERIYTIDDAQEWNKIFFDSGWQDVKAYDKFKSGIFGHSNLYFNNAKANYFVQFPTRRMTIIDQLYSINIEDRNTNTYRLATGSARLMGLNSIKFVLTPNTIKLVGIPLEKKFKNFNLYQNPYFAPRFRMVYQIKEVGTISDLTDYINSTKFDPKETVIFEDLNNGNKLVKNLKIKPNSTINIVSNKNEYIELKVNTNQPGVLIIADTYYPGWKAYVDDKIIRILPVNISQKGIFVDKGEHIVKFIYEPLSIKVGYIISAICYILALVILINKFFKRLV